MHRAPARSPDDKWQSCRRRDSGPGGGRRGGGGVRGAAAAILAHRGSTCCFRSHRCGHLRIYRQPRCCQLRRSWTSVGPFKIAVTHQAEHRMRMGARCLTLITSKWMSRTRHHRTGSSYITDSTPEEIDAGEGPGKMALGRAGEGAGDAAADAARAAMLAMRAWAHAASCCVAMPCMTAPQLISIANRLIRLMPTPCVLRYASWPDSVQLRKRARCIRGATPLAGRRLQARKK